MAKIFKILLTKILAPLYFLEAFKVLSVLKQIEGLEKNNNYEQAVTLRSTWLSKIKRKNSAPLWLSEAKYLFHQKMDYLNAINAFEKAISVYSEQPLHFGSINPLDMYYGASACAIMLGNRERGTEYYNEFAVYYEEFAINNGLNAYSSVYSEQKKWIEEQLDDKRKVTY